MMLRATLTILCLSAIAGGSAVAATPMAPVMPQVLAPAEIPTIAAIRANSRSAAIDASDTAPMPDVDAAAPVAAQDGDTRLKPALYSTRNEFRGDGFAYGSTAQAVQERSIKPAAGLALNVPLD